MEQRFKYPRTYHLPWSLGSTSDDKFLHTTDIFRGMEVVVTLKKDGENFSGYRDGFHARSTSSCDHKSRHWVKTFWSTRMHDVPEGFRVCGENLYAKHSIYYDSLPSYLMGFSVWNKEICLSWDETLEWFKLLDVVPVETIYRGSYDENILKELAINLNSSREEGYVIRNANQFTYKRFSENVAKYVRKAHVQTNIHWMRQEIVPNGLNVKV